MGEQDIETKYPTAIIYLTANEVVVRGPCLLVGVWVSGDGAVGDCQVYDGVSTNDPQKIHLEVLAGTSFNFIPPDPVLFKRGIYVVINAATTKVTVTWRSI